MHLRELFLKEDDRSTAVFAFGRFNPPTIGHKKLLDTLESMAQKARSIEQHARSTTARPQAPLGRSRPTGHRRVSTRPSFAIQVPGFHENSRESRIAPCRHLTHTTMDTIMDIMDTSIAVILATRSTHLEQQ